MGSTGYAPSPARNNITQILQLHDEIIGSLHQVVPFSEYDQTSAREARTAASTPRHIRWYSAESTPLRTPKTHTIRQHRRSLNISRSSAEHEPFTLSCSPQIAAEIAKIFLRVMQRFNIYEEYAARCEAMQLEMDELQERMTAWQDYDRAMETLSASLNPVNARSRNLKKASTIKDLLIKPIQRITRYELLLKDLCRLTPSCDDPESHAVFENVLCLLSETCRNVNEAKDDPEALRLMEISHTLQDRLHLPLQVDQIQTCS